jgi:hypothetical protein
VGNIDFKVIFVVENSNNSKKPGFGRKNQLRMWYHLKPYHSIQT